MSFPLVIETNAHTSDAHSPVSFQTTPADPILKRVETVGRVQPHVKAKLIDEEGKVVPVGTPGEVCIAGYLLQKGFGLLLISLRFLADTRLQILGRRGTDSCGNAMGGRHAVDAYGRRGDHG